MPAPSDHVAPGEVFPTFRDPAAQATFEHDGIVVLPLLSPDEARAFRDELLALRPAGAGPFFELFRDNPPPLRRKIDGIVRARLAEAVGALLVDHDFWAAAMLIKAPGPDGAIDLHEDWNMVDERRYRSGLAWVALNDTAVGNGGIHVVPGTNRVPLPPRYRDRSTALHEPALRAELERRTVAVDVPIGHVAFWDNRVLHGSGPNLSDDFRVNATLAFKPRAARLYHYRYMEDGRPHRFEIDREFMMEYEPFAPVFPMDGPHVLSDEVVEDRALTLTLDDLAVLDEPMPVR